MRFSIWLIVLCGLALIGQTLILAQSWQSSPFGRNPIEDAQVYWEWSGRIAAGDLVGVTPFLSAPLYPYFLGLLRWLGLGMAGIFAIQALLHTATLVLVADCGRRRFGAPAGLTAAALYLLLSGPAYFSGRLLGVSLQLFLVALLLWQCLILADKTNLLRLSLLGLVLGLSVLANPAMLLAVPVLVAWLAWGQPRERDLLGGLTTLAVALLVIAPATRHNWRASGEFIPVSAHSGVTFFHGNAPGATGTYHPIAGVSQSRLQQNQDAYSLAADATGVESWRRTSSYFLERGFSYLAENPGAALQLELRKFWWYLSGRDYGDIYVPALEKREDFGSRLHLAPLPLAWLIPLGWLGLVLLMRRRGAREALPEFLLIALPTLVVLLFWYSPRYRLPLAPVVAVLAAHALVSSLRLQRKRLASPLLAGVAAVLLLGEIGAGSLNRATDFDDADEVQGQFLFSVGSVLRTSGPPHQALPFLVRAIEAGYRNSDSLYSLAQAQMRQANKLYNSEDLARTLEGVELYRKAVPSLRSTVAMDPKLAEAWENLGIVLFWLAEEKDTTEETAQAYRVEALAALNRALDLEIEEGDLNGAARIQERLDKF